MGDPQDIQDLADLGIEKGVLDEIMLTLRHHNRTFAAGDQAISGERLYQERATGTHYRDVVRKYVKVLKSCAATKEDPGDLFRAMHHRGEELDTGLFEEEEERIKALRVEQVGLPVSCRILSFFQMSQNISWKRCSLFHCQVG